MLAEDGPWPRIFEHANSVAPVCEPMSFMSRWRYHRSWQLGIGDALGPTTCYGKDNVVEGGEGGPIVDEGGISGDRDRDVESDGPS